MTDVTDVAVVGSGPNGLAAAVTMARAGLSVEVYESAPTPGGGTRTMELIQPGYLHDVCSAVHPLALASPFFRAFDLSERIDLRVPDISYAHPLDAGQAGIAYRDLERTAEGLGRDGGRWRRVFGPLVECSNELLDVLTGSLLRFPHNPRILAELGTRALRLGTTTGATLCGFRTPEAAALFTGVAAHPVGPLPSLSSAGAGLLLGTMAHAGGWPVPVGGSQAIANALISDLRLHGGVVHTNHRIASLAELDSARVVLLDVAPQGFLDLAGTQLPERYTDALRRFRYGNAACKVDFILSGPIPWRHQDLAGASTVHVGGTAAEIAAAEADVAAGRHPESPFVLASQPTVFDPSRAPSGQHVLWTYCHVPAGSPRDMTEAVTSQLERFAPGFRDVVVRSRVTTAEQLYRYNANYVGGDFGSGAATLRQLIARPTLSLHPWATPLERVFLCSASTPPGPGVHGMGGYWAARLALKRVFGLTPPNLSEPPPGAD